MTKKASLPKTPLINGQINNGVTIVWLLATLGNSISARKNNEPSIRKKDILEVSIPETCDAIESNDEDLSLRHISNLLYGVTICYNKKTEYFLNDLTCILTQLTRTIKQNVNIKQLKGQSEYTTFSLQTISENLPTKRKKFYENYTIFLKDDKNFNIQDFLTFEDYLEDHHKIGQAFSKDAVTIRRKDYVKELGNVEQDFLAADLQDNYWGHNPTLEEIPLDVDFELDIDEIISQKGSVTNRSNQSHNDFNGLDIDNNSARFSSLRLDELQGQNLERPTNFNLDIQGDDVIEKSDNEDSKMDGPPSKKLKLSLNASKSYALPIKVDARIGLLTEVLRHRHDNYPILMEQCKTRYNHNRTEKQNWKNLLYSNDGIKLINDSWDFVFTNKDRSLNTSGQFPTIERGRRGNSSSVNESRTNSIRSTEVGRQLDSMDFMNGIFQDNDRRMEESILLNLDQINEDLMENEIEDHFDTTPGRKSSQDLLNLNFNLPPSSLGRSTSRYSTNNLYSDEPDVTEVLNMKSRGNKMKQNRFSKVEGNSRFLNESSELSEWKNDDGIISILGAQTRKFYDYIKERSLFLGETTQSTTTFRRLIFEDIVPSKLTYHEGDEEKCITKRVAAGAFFTLLNLASKDLVKLNISKTQNENSIIGNYSTNTGKNIIICV